MQSTKRPVGKPAASTWADKTRLAPMREATPDSEALSSDDDDRDLPKLIPTLSNSQPSQAHPRSQRRTSWLSEIQSGFPPRRPSLVASVSNTSQPPTPSTEVNAWPVGIPLGRVSSNPSSTTWSPAAGVWSSIDSQKGPTSRYLDIASPVQSHASTHAPASTSAEHTTSGSQKSSGPDLPFNIPLHPTPKTYRSQSYSVGQTEADIAQGAVPQSLTGSASTAPGRQRIATQQGSSWHRPSRPSMLSEVHQGNNMSALHEESDDLETVHGLSHAHLDQEETQAPINAQTYAQPVDEDRASEPELLTRKFNDLSGLGGHPGDGLDRRSPWQTSLGFGELPDGPQNRRHSMAQIPLHRANSNAATPASRFPRGYQPEAHRHLPPLETTSRAQGRVDHADDYGVSPTAVGRHGPALSSSLPQHYAMPNRPGYQGHQHSGALPRPGADMRLYLVTFKNSRADVYFVTPNAGLQVNVGDNVIVEADRGHDLGTVQYAGLNWVQARELKQQSNEEHFHTLMAGSINPKNATASQGFDTGSGNSKFGAPEPAIGDAGHGADLKPKMIKRLAQGHETATRRDKENNEAKARKICQQKVTEHGLDMEILDAEFQMDWKKLTFFYYAHSYVNFNILVTELFKIYKTRIWMSAINPASLSSPIGAGRGNGYDTGMLHRGSPMEGYHQDLDPTGAVPPNMNPSTSAFYEYANATRQTVPNTMQSAFQPPHPGYMFTPMVQMEYAAQPEMPYWSDASGNFMGSSLPKTAPPYNVAATSNSPAFQQRPLSSDRTSASAYQSFGPPVARPVGGDGFKPANTNY